MSAQPASQDSWLQAVRVLGLATILSVLVPWYIEIFHEGPREISDLLIPLCFAPLWAPFLWVLLRLNAKADRLTRKRATALAMSWGAILFVLSSTIFALIISSTRDGVHTEVLIFGVLALLQVTLITASVKAYRSTPSEPGDTRILLWRLGVGACIVLVILTPPFLHFDKAEPNEALAVASLRTINTAQIVYAEGHKTFAASLQQLGPSPGAELIDGVLAEGKKSGYLIALSSTPPDSSGRIAHYTVIARPQRFGKDGTYSLFTDESGVFHFTKENRPPTVNDPVL